MGLNLAGIAIDKNFNRDINQLGEAFEWAVNVIDESEFQEAKSIFSSKEKDIFYVYFTNNGTMIFSPMEWAIEKYHSANSDSMCFAFSETSMTYIFSYRDKNSNYREFMADNGQKQSEIGEPLEIEKMYPDESGLIYKLIEDLIGKNFHSIESNEIVFKCRRLPSTEYIKRSEALLQNEMEIEKRKDDERLEKYMKEIGLDPKEAEKRINKKKKWWEIWK